MRFCIGIDSGRKQFADRLERIFGETRRALDNAAGAVAGSGGLMWNRKSVVSLLGGFGEIRLGRDYTPQFWSFTVYDPFGTNGVSSR